MNAKWMVGFVALALAGTTGVGADTVAAGDLYLVVGDDAQVWKETNGLDGLQTEETIVYVLDEDGNRVDADGDGEDDIAEIIPADERVI